jgi:hypothetical protein
VQYVDFDQIGGSFDLFWNHEYSGRCIASITAPKKKLSGHQRVSNDEQIKFWTDGEEVLKRHQKYFENTYFLGEAFPLINLNLGAAGHAGYFNKVKYQFADNTVWFFPIDKEEELVFSKNAFFYQKTIELAKYLTSEGRGEFIVSMPDIAGNVDALAHLRGSENVMMDMIMDPEKIKKELNLIQAAWETMTKEVFSIERDNNLGGSSIGWMGTYAKGLHSQLQSDMSVMLSRELFEEFITPELQKQASFLEYPTYHFDGIEQERHLDTLLSIEKIRMIQYTYVAGQPPPMEKLDILKRIQKGNKLLLLIVKPEWVQPILENLSAKGLFLRIAADSPEQADYLFEIVRTYSKVR